jgi:hypothetical protein
MGNHWLLESVEKRKWEREMGESGRFSEIRLSTSTVPGEADWGGHFRSRDITTLVTIRRKCTVHILKLSDTRRRPLAVAERTSKSNLYDNNTRKY